MTIETREFDVTEYLDSPEMIAAYIEAAMEENDPAFTAKAIGDVARALGMTDIARRSGMQRETLYKALSAKGNPTLGTMTSVFDAMGLKLAVVPKVEERQFRNKVSAHREKGSAKKAAIASKKAVRERRAARAKGKAAVKETA